MTLGKRQGVSTVTGSSEGQKGRQYHLSINSKSIRDHSEVFTVCHHRCQEQFGFWNSSLKPNRTEQMMSAQCDGGGEKKPRNKFIPNADVQMHLSAQTEVKG